MANAELLSILGLPIFCSNVNANANLNGSAKKIAAVFAAPKTGNIQDLGCRVNVLNGTVPAQDIRLETVTSAGPPSSPSGTLAAANTNKSWTPGATGWTWQTMTSNYAATAGEILAVVLTGSSNDATNYINANVSQPTFNADDFGGFPFPIDYDISTATTWVVRHRQISGLGVRYDDGTLVPFLAPIDTTASTSYSATSTTPWFGTSWLAAPETELIGCLCGINLLFALAGTTGTLEVRHATDAATVTIPPGSATTVKSITYDLRKINPQAGATAGNLNVLHLQWDPVALIAGERYHIQMRVSTGTAFLRHYGATWESAASRAGCLGKIDWSEFQSGTLPQVLRHYETKHVPLLPIISAVSAGGRVILTS